MGLGLLGRGVGDAAFLAPLCKDLIVTDRKSEQELAPSLAQLKQHQNIRYTLGGHNRTDFEGRDLIVKAAGVPLDSPYIRQAKEHGIPVRMSADLLVELSGARKRTVGITGTRGKSTVTHMIAHVLAEAGKRNLLGGNVRGVSNLALLPKVQEDTTLVLELDSWQCQGFREAAMSPAVAVLTSFTEDHLNYYSSMERYFEDKAAIYEFQETGDVLVVEEKVLPWIARYGKKPRRHIVAKKDDIPAQWELQLPGEHNRENAACALHALRELGVPEETIRVGLASFQGLPGRLERLRDIAGVAIYNDNNATTPTATIASLKALDTGRKNIILIMGGADKGLEMEPLIPYIKEACKRVVLLPGTGTERVQGSLSEATLHDTIPRAISTALEGSSPGDIILFSPAFASFGMFANEYDRNDQFTAAVQSLA